MMLTFTEWLIASLVLAAGSTLQGAVGTGIGLVSVPLLALIEPRLVPGSALFSSLALTGLMLVRERRAVDLFGIKWGIAGRIGGTLVASYLLVNLPTEETNLIIGALVLLGVILSISGLSVTRITGTLIGAGVLSGIMGTLSSVGGPPMALLYQDAKGPKIRATLAGFFILGTNISLLALILVGNFGWSEFVTSLTLVPGVLLGYLLSGQVKTWLDKGYMRPAILAVCAASAFAVIVKQF